MVAEHLQSRLYQIGMLLLVDIRVLLHCTHYRVKNAHGLLLPFAGLGGTIARPLCVSFAHVLAVFRLPIPAVAFVVIYLAVEIHPNHAAARGRRRGWVIALGKRGR